MEVILLDNIRNKGSLGDRVKVKAGFGRNFLIPQGKALAATKENLAKFEAKRADLEKAANEKRFAAEERAKPLTNLEVTIFAQVTEGGALFGSVGFREIINALTALGHNIDKSEISMPEGPIHQTGEHDVALLLHPEVAVKLKVKVVPENKSDLT